MTNQKIIDDLIIKVASNELNYQDAITLAFEKGKNAQAQIEYEKQLEKERIAKKKQSLNYLRRKTRVTF